MFTASETASFMRSPKYLVLTNSFDLTVQPQSIDIPPLQFVATLYFRPSCLHPETHTNAVSIRRLVRRENNKTVVSALSLCGASKILRALFAAVVATELSTAVHGAQGTHRPSTSEFLSDIAKSDFGPIGIDVTIPWSVCLIVCLCLSVCLSRSCIVLKRQKISTRFLLHTTAPCACQIALKFSLHRSTLSSPNFAPK